MKREAQLKSDQARLRGRLLTKIGTLSPDHAARAGERRTHVVPETYIF